MQMEEPLPEPRGSYHGVLSYRRESEWTPNTFLPPSASDQTVLCEFCGAKAKAPLYFSKTTYPEDFCCAQYMKMFKKLEQHWRLLQEKSGESSQEHDFTWNTTPTWKLQKIQEKTISQDVLQQVAEERAKSLRKAKKPPSDNRNLAIIAFIDGTEGVCIVYDDIRPSCPIRAFFQSSGIAICYHSNGSTWLHMDMWGGLSLNENRSKSIKWKWADDGNNRWKPFKPIHRSLNKNIGVRVHGRESVMVTFLASGQQARFNVGSCTKPSEPSEPIPSLSKEELMLQVSQLNARLALERLRRCVTLHSDTRRDSLRPPPGLISQGQRLLRLSFSMCMEEKDRAYIQHCLRDCQ